MIKVGIIGTGRIAARFVPEAGAVKEIELACVYNPRRSSAERFAAEHGIARAADRLEDFLQEVDAVYTASPHETHVPYTRQALLAGKHVLCEKPLSFSAEEAKELFALAKEKHLVLMEAIKTAYCPGFQALVEMAKSGVIGEICDVEACFTKLSPSNVREIWDEQYGGSFTELGTYPLLPIIKLLGANHTGIQFQSIRMGSGRDGYTKAVLSYPNALALAKTGLSAKSEGQLIISGTNGYILAESPWWLTKTFEVRYEDSSRREAYHFPFEGAGLRYEIRAFAEEIAAQRKATSEAGNVSACGAADTLPVVTKEESIWLASQMEAFLLYKGEMKRDCTAKPDSQAVKCPDEMPLQLGNSGVKAVRIWAHRGCSMRCPENTLEAFAAAAAIRGLTGIELDVQMTKDGEIVVIHDETVDRTTDGTGAVQSLSLQQIKSMKIQGGSGSAASVPTLREVFDLFLPACNGRGLMINIEMKNGRIRYEGMEEKVLALVEQYHLNDSIVYSSFLPESMELIRRLNPAAKTAILGNDFRQCLKDMERVHADAIHPWNGGLPLNEADIEKIQGIPVRVWNSEEPFFNQSRSLKETRMTKYARLGATDIITNVPESYLL